MRTEPLRTDGASRMSGEGTLPERKRDLKQRVFRIGPPPRSTSLPRRWQQRRGDRPTRRRSDRFRNVRQPAMVPPRDWGVSTLCPPRLPSATAVISPMTVSHSPGRLCLGW
jgi:hypothetical protein